MNPTNQPRARGSGSLRVRAGYYYLRFRTADGVRQEERTGVRADGSEAARRRAEQLLVAKVKAAARDDFAPTAARRLRFEDLVQLYRTSAEAKGNKSVDRIPDWVRHLGGAFAGMPAITITTARVDAYALARRKEGAATSTINLELSMLRRAFKLATTKLRYPRDATPAIVTPTPQNTRTTRLDPATAVAFLAALRADDALVADVTEAALLTLWRKASVLHAQWTWGTWQVDDGHLVGGSITLPGAFSKNGEAVTLPVGGRLLDVIDRQWQARVPSCPYVFHRNGRAPLTRFDYAWDRAAAAVGLGGRDAKGDRVLRFHDLRRTGAVLLRQAGVDASVVKHRGGWKSDTLFRRYADLFAAHEQVAAQDAIDAALATPGPRRVVPLRRKA